MSRIRRCYVEQLEDRVVFNAGADGPAAVLSSLNQTTLPSTPAGHGGPPRVITDFNQAVQAGLVWPTGVPEQASQLIAAWAAAGTAGAAADQPMDHSQMGMGMSMDHGGMSMDSGAAESPNAAAMRLAGVDPAQEGLLPEDDPWFSHSDQDNLVVGQSFPVGARVLSFDVAAINVDITINKFGDHDPTGKMFALVQDIPAIRAEEAAHFVSTGLADDPIQPLTLYAQPGDIVEIRFINLLSGTERASIHPHGLSYSGESMGSAVGYNSDSTVAPGGTITYRFYIDDIPQNEGVHYMHSEGTNFREQVSHGLFGGILVEPKGSVIRNPRSGLVQTHGWDAIVEDPGGKDYRDYALYYHEIGNETFLMSTKNGGKLPLIDPYTDAYRPGTRAINYRSEPFLDRLQDMDTRLKLDPKEGTVYSSYAFGDPGTPILASYVGDPVKMRLVHGGGEVIHSHHLHGGGDRWPMQPGTNPAASEFGIGTRKEPRTAMPESSLLVDSQQLVPGDSFTAEIEGGAGGLQGSVGDFLYHCHMNEHYVAGMWGFWRVYNTNHQEDANGNGRLEALEDANHSGTLDQLMPLSDRAPKANAVTSADLIGKILPNGTVLTAANIKPWVESFLPPQGVPYNRQDASVSDWTVQNPTTAPLYLREPEGTQSTPNFTPLFPNQRFPFLFDPETMRLSYPMRSPHIGNRPPFAPGAHGPTAFLHDVYDGNFVGVSPALTPQGTPIRKIDLRGIQIPIPVTDSQTLNEGLMFVDARDEAAMRNGDLPVEPNIIRVNTGDTLRITLANNQQVTEDKIGSHWITIHPHFAQFDVQTTDGVTVGFNFAQSVRPLSVSSTPLKVAVKAGDTKITVLNAGMFHKGAYLALGLADGQRFDIKQIVAITGNVITLSSPALDPHPVGALVSDEFVNFEYYYDFQAGSIYNHDHVNYHQVQAGLFESFQVEPAGTIFRDQRMNAVLTKNVAAGAKTITVADATPFFVGMYVGIGLDKAGEKYEPREVTKIVGNVVTLSQAVAFAHAKDQLLSRVDRPGTVRAGDPGTTFSLIPQTLTGAAGTLSGTVADIIPDPRITDPGTPDHPTVGSLFEKDFNKTSAFREQVIMFGDNRPAFVNAGGQEVPTGTWTNYGLAPFQDRLAQNSDPSLLFSSVTHGDPRTSIVRAYAGDPVVFRVIGGAGNHSHPFVLPGIPFRLEQFDRNGIRVETAALGQSERFDLATESVGTGDYLWMNGVNRWFEDGNWGILRVHDRMEGDLAPLPGNVPPAPTVANPGFPVLTETGGAPPKAPDPGNPGPPGAPVQEFFVNIMDTNLVFNAGDGVNYSHQKVFVLDQDVVKVTRANGVGLEPLVLHVTEGSVVEIHLRNRLTDQAASFAPSLLSRDVAKSLGITVGYDYYQAARPGQVITYRFYVPKGTGLDMANVMEFGNPVASWSDGAFAAINIEPEGSEFRDPKTGAPTDHGADVVVVNPVTGEAHRTYTVLFQDEDAKIGDDVMPYPEFADRKMGLNYHVESLRNRAASNPAGADWTMSSYMFGDPETPIFRAYAGDPIKFNVGIIRGEKTHVFTVDGHQWPLNPRQTGSDLRDVAAIAPNQHVTAYLLGGAGGPGHYPGDYMYGDQRLPFNQAGLWGIFRVLPEGATAPDLLPLAAFFGTGGAAAGAVQPDGRGSVGTTATDPLPAATGAAATPVDVGGAPMADQGVPVKSGSTPVPGLDQTAIQTVVGSAIAGWTAAGGSPALAARLGRVRFVIADLPGATMGMAAGDTVVLDVDAAGRGWFVDPTPAVSEEFRATGPGGELTAIDARARGRIDLLTVVAHELGHVAGLAHNDVPGGLMLPALPAGVRRPATATDLSGTGGAPVAMVVVDGPAKPGDVAVPLAGTFGGNRPALFDGRLAWYEQWPAPLENRPGNSITRLARYEQRPVESDAPGAIKLVGTKPAADEPPGDLAQLFVPLGLLNANGKVE